MINKIQELGVIPVIAIDDANNAKDLAKALIDGGLPVAEVTFRTEAGKEAIKIISSEFPDMLVGAGTVINVEQAKLAVSLGAKFIVSPGFDEETVDYCINNNIPVFPGCITPTEIMAAINKGLTVVKFFPSEDFGGLKMIKALSGPFPKLKFMPTGGINANNLKEYLSSDKIFACGGTWMVKKDLINNKQFDIIRDLTKEAVMVVKSIRG